MKSPVLLALLVAAYVLVVRRIFAFAQFLGSGDASALVPRINLHVPETWVPLVIGVIVVLGLLSRWGWAWWLAAVAVGVEMALYLPKAVFWAGLSLTTVASWIKLGWLAALVWMLVRTSWLGGLGTPKGRRRSA